MWFFTVPSVMFNFAPISLLLQPAASSFSTPSSRSESGSASDCETFFPSRAERRLSSAIIRAVTAGSRTEAPLAAARTDSLSLSAEQAFKR